MNKVLVYSILCHYSLELYLTRFLINHSCLLYGVVFIILVIFLCILKFRYILLAIANTLK